MRQAPEKDATIKAGTDAADTRWFPVGHLPDRLAFDHSEIIERALEELGERAGRFDQAIMDPLFAMLPEHFTLTQLQEAFDAIHAGHPEKEMHESDKRNFRKRVRIAKIVEPIPGATLRGNHRPAQLYRYNPQITAAPQR